MTVCTQGKRCILSDIIVGDGVLDVPQVRLTKYGAMVEQTLQEINRTYAHISIEKYVIMPNHIHMLVHIEENGTSRTPSPTDEIENSAKRANAKTKGAKIGRPQTTLEDVPASFLRHDPAYRAGQLNASELARVRDLRRTTAYKYIGLLEEK